MPTQSPTKSKAKASPSVSWSDTETINFLDLITTHKAAAGDGLNFKASFWKSIADSFANPEKGAPKTAKSCKDKWMRVSDFVASITAII